MNKDEILWKKNIRLDLRESSAKLFNEITLVLCKKEGIDLKEQTAEKKTYGNFWSTEETALLGCSEQSAEEASPNVSNSRSYCPCNLM